MRDNFQAFLTEGAEFSKGCGLPILKSCHEIPENLVAFSDTKRANNFNSFVHFYEADEEILPFTRNPQKYFPRLSQFRGVIGCDISVYRNMSPAIQLYHTFLNRALTFWLQNHGISVIPNLRYGDKKSYSFCFEGIPKNSIISIGTHGCIKKKDDIACHINGISETIKRLKPEAIVFYGAVKEDMLFKLRSEKVEYKIFKSDISNFYNARKNSLYPSLFDEMNIGGA